MKSTILVIGATGNIGKELIKRLVKTDHTIKAAVRSSSNTEELEKLGVEMITANLTDKPSLIAAMQGVNKVFFAIPLSPNMVELSRNIILAAVESGVTHLVKISGAGAELEAITMAKWHRTIEREMEQSGIHYTFLRPNSFMQNMINYSSHTIQDHGAFYAPMGEGKVSLIDAGDIAHVAFHVLTEAGHENRAYYLSGPEALSPEETATILSSVTNKKITYVDVPAEAAQKSMIDSGMTLEMANVMLELYSINKLGYTAEISNSVEEITGQKPTSFKKFAEKNKETFLR